MEKEIKRQNLALEIILLRDRQIKKDLTFDEMLKKAAGLIREYEFDHEQPEKYDLLEKRIQELENRVEQMMPHIN